MRIKHSIRYELKYVLLTNQIKTIVADLTGRLAADAHSDETGHYRVTSLYYDTAAYKAYWDKIEGHKFRRKLRIRVYGADSVLPETACFVEIKQRHDKSCAKRRIRLPYAAAEGLCTGLEDDIDEGQLPDYDRTIQQEILYLTTALQLEPACVVSYDRLAFNGDDYAPGLRITFDTNLTGRVHALSLLSRQQGENHFVLPPDWCIMEIKVNDRVPYWLTEVLGKHCCTLRRVSKYCATLEACKGLLQQSSIR